MCFTALCSAGNMSGGYVIEEAFARMLLHESILDDANLTASLSRITSLKDLRVVSRHCMYRANSDEDCRTFDNDSNTNVIQKSLSENGILLKKRLLRSGFLSPFRRRKSVTFADTRGRDLVQVREFDKSVDPLQNCLSYRRRSVNPVVSSPKYIAMFCQPCANYSDFMRQLCTGKVCLENAQIISENIIIGTVKVQNLSYEKYVTVRYTTDAWKSHNELDAKFLHSESADIDIFTFRITIPKGAESVAFCIRFCCNGFEYWDNNNDCNYCVKARDLPNDGGQIK